MSIPNGGQSAPLGDAEMHRIYWQVQYERIAQHESGRYQVSAFVLTGSLVALGFVTQLGSAASPRFVAGLAVAIVNLLAILFISGGRRWVKIHQDRAAAVLRVIAPDLVSMQDAVNRAHGVALLSSDRKSPLRAENLLASMHALIAAATLILSVVD